jgi:hypothetical protein
MIRNTKHERDKYCYFNFSVKLLIVGIDGILILNSIAGFQQAEGHLDFHQALKHLQFRLENKSRLYYIMLEGQ